MMSRSPSQSSCVRSALQVASSVNFSDGMSDAGLLSSPSGGQSSVHLDSASAVEFYCQDGNGSHNYNVLGVPAITFVVNSGFEASRSIPNSYDL